MDLGESTQMTCEDCVRMRYSVSHFIENGRIECCAYGILQYWHIPLKKEKLTKSPDLGRNLPFDLELGSDIILFSFYFNC